MDQFGSMVLCLSFQYFFSLGGVKRDWFSQMYAMCTRVSICELPTYSTWQHMKKIVITDSIPPKPDGRS